MKPHAYGSFAAFRMRVFLSTAGKPLGTGMEACAVCMICTNQKFQNAEKLNRKMRLYNCLINYLINAF